jgi:hypothetical protein
MEGDNRTGKWNKEAIFGKYPYGFSNRDKEEDSG